MICRGKRRFPPRKVGVCSEESLSFLRGKWDQGTGSCFTNQLGLSETGSVPSSRSRVPQTLVNNVDFVWQEGSPFLCGEGRKIGNFEHQGPHFKPSGARLDVREILLRELHSAETLRCLVGLWHESFECLRLNLIFCKGTKNPWNDQIF